MGMTFRSEYLGVLREMLGGYEFMLHDTPEQRLVVVDANVVINAAKQRRRFHNPTARTSIEEVADSTLWLLIAPDFLRVEVVEKLWEAGWSADEIEQHTAPLFRRIQILPDPPDSARMPSEFEELAKRDPKDLPYARLYSWARADFVLTADADLQKYCRVARPGTNLRRDLLLDARDLARETAESAGRTRSTAIVATMAFELGRKVGPGVLLALGGAGLYVWSVLSSEQKASITRGIIEPLNSFAKDLADHQAKAFKLEKNLDDVLQVRDDLSLEDRVYRFLLRKPRRLDELKKQLATIQGATAQSIEKLARADRRLRVSGDGEISVKLAPQVVRRA